MDWEAISVTTADTLHVPYDTGTFASSQIYVGGNAVRQAAQDVIERIRVALADHYQRGSRTDSFRQGWIHYHPQKGRRGVSLLSGRQFPKSALAKNPTIIGRSSFKAVESPASFGICWAKVAVDKTARTVEVRQIIEAVDVGTPINPEIVKGQVEGGVGMGLGFAIMEQIEFDKRAEKPSSSDLLHYKIPTALDMPEIHVYLPREVMSLRAPLVQKALESCPPSLFNSLWRCLMKKLLLGLIGFILLGSV